MVGCIWRNGEVIIPRGNDVLLANDHLIIISLPEASESCYKLFHTAVLGGSYNEGRCGFSYIRQFADLFRCIDVTSPSLGFIFWGKLTAIICGKCVHCQQRTATAFFYCPG
ncbi:MAG: hypothetical protein ACOX3A_06085 [bacterium]